MVWKRDAKVYLLRLGGDIDSTQSCWLRWQKRFLISNLWWPSLSHVTKKIYLLPIRLLFLYGSSWLRQNYLNYIQTGSLTENYQIQLSLTIPWKKKRIFFKFFSDQSVKFVYLSWRISRLSQSISLPSESACLLPNTPDRQCFPGNTRGWKDRKTPGEGMGRKF